MPTAALARAARCHGRGTSTPSLRPAYAAPFDPCRSRFCGPALHGLVCCL